MKIEDVLKQFDLSDKEIKVYLSCLELGQTGVTNLARKAGIKRSTVYDILAELGQRGLIGITQKGKKRRFYAEEPEKLFRLLDDKRAKLEAVMPELKSFYNTAGNKPRIRYYEGVEGLKQVYRDTLGYEGFLHAFVTENIIKHLGQDFADEYKAKRKKAKIFVKVIGPDTEEIKDYKDNDEEDLQATRLVPRKEFPFSIEMNIYGNKIAFMSFKEKIGIIIESNEISSNMNLLFNLAWKGAKG